MRVLYRDHTSRSSDREGGFHEGYRGWSPDSRITLLANTFPVGSPPVVSLLAVVPDHSGASVRDLHPLPNSSTSIAVTAKVDIATITRHHRSQAHCDTGGEGIFGTLASPLRHMTRREYWEAYNASIRVEHPWATVLKGERWDGIDRTFPWSTDACVYHRLWRALPR